MCHDDAACLFHEKMSSSARVRQSYSTSELQPSDQPGTSAFKRPGSAAASPSNRTGTMSEPVTHRAPPEPPASLHKEEAAHAQRRVEELIYELQTKERELRAAREETATMATTLETTEKVLHETIHKERALRRKISDSDRDKRDAKAKLGACEDELKELKAKHDALRRRAVHGRSIAILESTTWQKAALEHALDAGLRSCAIAQPSDPVRFLGACLLAAGPSLADGQPPPPRRGPRPPGGAAKGRKYWGADGDVEEEGAGVPAVKSELAVGKRPPRPGSASVHGRSGARGGARASNSAPSSAPSSAANAAPASSSEPDAAEEAEMAAILKRVTAGQLVAPHERARLQAYFDAQATPGAPPPPPPSKVAKSSAKAAAPPACPRPSGTSITWAAGKVTYRLHLIDGWSVWAAAPCFGKHARLRQQLSFDLAEMSRVLPAAAVEKLQAFTAIWINDELKYPSEGGAPAAARVVCFHHGSSAVVAKGDLAEKGDCIEIGSCASYLEWAAAQPAMLLYAGAHAFHRMTAADNGAAIESAYEECLGSGVYDKPRRSNKPASVAEDADADETPMAAVDAAEFFAEASEAFFSSRNLYGGACPRVHAELHSLAPAAYAMCEQAWRVKGHSLLTRHEVPARWLERTAKVPREALRAALLADSRQGIAEPGAFDGALAQSVPGLVRAEARALRLTAEQAALSSGTPRATRSSDERVDVRAFIAWLTANHGSFDEEEIL